MNPEINQSSEDSKVTNLQAVVMIVIIIITIIIIMPTGAFSIHGALRLVQVMIMQIPPLALHSAAL
jgi:hypothetical protein